MRTVRPVMMTPLGYIAKTIVQRPEWLDVPHVRSIYSVATCISEDFADYVNLWRHNGYWIFDRPEIISDICFENEIDLTGLRFLYLESELKQFDPNSSLWVDYGPDDSFETCVRTPGAARLLGYDVVTIYCGNTPEHSPLSCNHVASNVPVNECCLINKLEEARFHVEAGDFANSEPGYLRIIAVHELEIGTNQAMNVSR